MLESASTTLGTIVVLSVGFAAAAYLYHKSYKWLVLRKMIQAFLPGDPVLEMAAVAKDVPHQSGHEGDEHWVLRSEQDFIDKIVHGRDTGHYYLIVGEKGTGKSSMLIEAMRKINGDAVAMLEAHPDMEIFRMRLGKALNYEYHEDYIGGYFSERGPRESTALLDIERAMNKLEKVAMIMRRQRGKPLVVIVNQMHLNSDDYWVYERFKQLATRMEVIPVTDLPREQAITALANYRLRYFKEELDDDQLEDIYRRVGGRLSFLNRVAKSSNMIATCEKIKDIEKKWFLNQCWILGSSMDDDVMDQQKWAVCGLLLFSPRD
jgi:hypothetical protein